MGYINNKVVFVFVVQFALLWFNFWGVTVKNEGEQRANAFCETDFIGITQSYGYKTEAHNVTTPDGWTLTLFRVSSNSISTNNSVAKPVVYLQHGAAGSSYLFVVVGPDRSLVYSLVDAGYDVWLGNCRGNVYGKEHEQFTPEDSEYWNYSIDEYVNIDIPSTIDYILETTNVPKLTYIGHSLGTTTILMLLSAKPEYNEKLNTAILLAPVTYWTTKNPTRTLMYQVGDFMKTFWPNGQINMAPLNPVLPFLWNNFCAFSRVTLDICYMPYNLIMGANRGQFELEKFSHLWCHYPAGVSAKAYIHFIQLMRSGKLQYYDYEDESLNYQNYHQNTPPEYNVTNIMTSMVIFQSPNDPMSTEDDVRVLISKLPSDTPIIYKKIRHEQFNHADVILGKDAKRLVYDRLLKILRKIHSNHSDNMFYLEQQ